MFRGLHSFSLKDAEISQLPNFVDQRDEDGMVFESHFLEGMHTNLKALVESNGPVEYTFDMFPPLLTYAQTFERLPPFKDAMTRKRYSGNWINWIDYPIQYGAIRQRNPFG